MQPPAAAPGLACPVCGHPVDQPAGASCPACGLPGAGQAALVVARIGATLDELARDRDALLATLHAAAPTAPPRTPTAPPRTPTAPPRTPTPPRHLGPRPTSAAPPPPPPPPPPSPVPKPARRLSPQQVLLALGALLLVAGAVAFGALAWTRLGLAFQATVMLLVTGAACAASAWTARRGLRATEETLAAASTALLAVDLAAAHAKGLLGFDAVPVRLWSAISCAVVVGTALVLGRSTRSTAAWPLAALLAAQPIPFLLIDDRTLAGAVGVALAFALAVVDLAAALRLRAALAPVGRLLALLWTLAGALGGLERAYTGSPGRSWSATAVLTAAGAVALLLLRLPQVAGLVSWPVRGAGTVGGALGLGVAGSLTISGSDWATGGAAAGLALLTGGALAAAHPFSRVVLASGGAALAVVCAGGLWNAGRPGPLSLIALSAVVPAVLAAVRLPRLGVSASAAVVAAPAVSVLLAQDAGWLAATTAGLLLAVTGAAAFGGAALRPRSPEEWACAGGGAVAGALAAATSGTVQAWGQVGLQLAVVGAAAAAYAMASRRPWMAAAAVADLVGACWIALAGAEVTTPEAYSLPAAAALLLFALPRLRSEASSWAAEAPAAAVTVVPSAFVVVAQPTALRLALVIAAATALAVVGTGTHRQAPFVIGAASLGFVVVGQLGPYAPLLPRWITLTAAGLLLLVLGATYERRRKEAREAVAWVTQMR